MTNEKKYDLQERTAKFGEAIIDLGRGLQKNIVSASLISQLIRSGTSIGANYCEADCAESRKDFEHKIGICKKEAKETTHWLRMLLKAVPSKKNEIASLWKEANELCLIFSSIINKSKINREI